MINNLRYLANTQKVIGSAIRAKTNNGFTINLLNRFEGSNAIKTQAIKHMKDGSFIEQICMDYGNGNAFFLTTRTNTKNPFFSVVFKRDGKVAARCIQNGDSFVYDDAHLAYDSKVKKFMIKKFLYRKNNGMGFKMENNKVVSDKLEDSTIKNIVETMLGHFKRLG